MREPITVERLTKVLKEMVAISRNVRDITKINFGDPFGRFDDADCNWIATAITTGSVAGYAFFGLVDRCWIQLNWTKVGGTLRFELNAQGEHYAPTIAAVHEYFRREGLMESFLISAY